jgi:hypothetical protein
MRKTKSSILPHGKQENLVPEYSQIVRLYDSILAKNFNMWHSQNIVEIARETKPKNCIDAHETTIFLLKNLHEV